MPLPRPPRTSIGASTDAAPALGPVAVPDPRRELCLLVAWTNPFEVFAGNLADRLLRRVIPKVAISSAPEYGFWHYVDLRTPFPRRGLIDSVFAHAALLGLLYAVSIWPLASTRLVSPFFHRQISSHALDAYLPELRGAPTQAAYGKHDPVLAKRRILSLPRNPDNLRQTVVAPPKITLKQNIELPNFVTYRPEDLPVLAKQEVLSPPRSPENLRHAVVAPPTLALNQRVDLPDANGPEHLPVLAKHEILSLPKNPDSLRHAVVNAPRIKLKQQVDLPDFDLAEAKPRLALPAPPPQVVKPASDRGHLGAGSASGAHRAPEPAPEAPHAADAQRSIAQIIALNLHPAEVRPPEVPSGNRSGAFAASPTGNPLASGTPGNVSSESKAPYNAPAGINVTAATPPAPAGHGNPSSSPAREASANPELRSRLTAAMRPTPMTDAPERQAMAHESLDPTAELEHRLFAGRRSYTLAVNMPNLNASIGSWLIHFAERAAPVPGAAQVPIAAPEVLSKSDPAYPGDLIADGVQGTVVLSATIRTDGSVGEIAILKSLDPRLDRNAAEAFSHWIFRPALKNGQTIDLEALVTVPFRTRSAK